MLLSWLLETSKYMQLKELAQDYYYYYYH